MEPVRRLLGLGRSVSHRVPRAGLLRRWEDGPPQFATETEDNFNTQIVPDPPGGSYDDLDFQKDEWPQRLILTTYPSENLGVPWGPAESGRVVHRLFCGRHGPIRVFPDHMHEGQVQLPTSFPEETWPRGPDVQPLPEVVARGIDHDHGVIKDLVVAYDGSLADVGRIVADATWHHYFNVNLKGFPHGASVHADLAQYYTNLALWLAPAEKRRQIACWIRGKVIQSPSVQMSLGNAKVHLGRVATHVARHLYGPCAVRDVLQMDAFAAMSAAGRVEPPLDLLVGSVIEIYVQAIERAAAAKARRLDADDDILLTKARVEAFDEFKSDLARAVNQLRANDPGTT